jgi:lipopolysaccharide transport system permease protein
LKQKIVIDANQNQLNYLSSILNYKDLLFILSKKEIALRYKNTLLGLAWSILRPLITALIMFVVFKHFAKLDAKNPRYLLMVFAAILPWTFFSNTISEMSNSLVSNANLVRKVYFPRIILPLSSILTTCFDFLLSLLIFFGFCIAQKVLPSSNIVYLPFALIHCLILSIGIGLLLSILNSTYRDFRFIIPFILQIGLYATPIGYDVNIIPNSFHWVLFANPVIAIIQSFKFCLLGNDYAIDTNVLLAPV